MSGARVELTERDTLHLRASRFVADREVACVVECVRLFGADARRQRDEQSPWPRCRADSPCQMSHETVNGEPIRERHGLRGVDARKGLLDGRGITTLRTRAEGNRVQRDRVAITDKREA